MKMRIAESIGSAELLDEAFMDIALGQHNRNRNGFSSWRAPGFVNGTVQSKDIFFALQFATIRNDLWIDEQDDTACMVDVLAKSARIFCLPLTVDECLREVFLRVIKHRQWDARPVVLQTAVEVVLPTRCRDGVSGCHSCGLV